jgi:hypothetical protein
VKIGDFGSNYSYLGRNIDHKSYPWFSRKTAIATSKKKKKRPPFFQGRNLRMKLRTASDFSRVKTFDDYFVSIFNLFLRQKNVS